MRGPSRRHRFCRARLEVRAPVRVGRLEAGLGAHARELVVRDSGLGLLHVEAHYPCIVASEDESLVRRPDGDAVGLDGLLAELELVEPVEDGLRVKSHAT